MPVLYLTVQSNSADSRNYTMRQKGQAGDIGFAGDFSRVLDLTISSDIEKRTAHRKRSVARIRMVLDIAHAPI